LDPTAVIWGRDAAKETLASKVTKAARREIIVFNANSWLSTSASVKYLQRIARGQAGAKLIRCQSRQERVIDRNRQRWHLLAFGETNDGTKEGREPLLLLSASDRIDDRLLKIDESRRLGAFPNTDSNRCRSSARR